MQLLTFITLSRNPESSNQIRDVLNATAGTRVLADWSNPDEFFADVVRLQPSAAIITLEGEQNSERDFALIRKLVAASPRTSIVTAASNASPGLILGSIRAGSREFLQLPIIPDEFHTVLQRIEEFAVVERNNLSKDSRTLGVFSGKGGAGVSFMATNLAAAMNAPTLLMDLNLQSGDTASFLGLEPRYSLTDFVANRTRLDDSLINSLLTPHSIRLALLAAPLEAHEAEDIKPEHITEVIHLLSQRYESLVLDLQHTFDPITIAALDLADDVLLIMTLDIPGIRSTKRALKVFERLGYPKGKIHVVVNRWSKNIDVELQKVETHLDEQLIGFVPNDYRKVMESINLGRPLVQADPSSKLSVEIKRIATLLSGNDNQRASTQTRKRLLGNVFGRSSTNTLELKNIPDTA